MMNFLISRPGHSKNLLYPREALGIRYSLLLLVSLLFILPETRAQNGTKQADIFTHNIPGQQTPWTHTNFKNDPENFSFAIVADRTNGHRKGIFANAIDKLNDLQPEFVLSVGDLIEGYTTDTTELRRQWNEFNGLLEPLEMPFFRVPGNHDLSNEVQLRLWRNQFGPDYYHFIYKNVLFLILNSSDGDGFPFTDKQLAYAEETLKDHPDVRWTFVLMHHPVWNKRDENGFSRVETGLQNRDYTVIAGHTHRYLASTYNDQNYYILATTGGSTRMRGFEFGETDHISWITMTDEGPSLVNLELDGILMDDFSNERTHELARRLSVDAEFKPLILLPTKSGDAKGKIYLNLRNNADLPLLVKTRFFQHPSLRVTGNPESLVLSESSQQHLSMSLQGLQNTSTQRADTLEMQYGLEYISKEQGLPQLSHSLKIPINRTAPEIIDREMPVFTDSKEVMINNEFEGALVVYTTDGSEPRTNSKVYSKPFKINQTTQVKTKLMSDNFKASSLTESMAFEKLAFVKPLNIKMRDLKPGLDYTYYEGVYKFVPDFSELNPIKSGVMTNFDLDPIKEQDNHFAMLIQGYIEIKEDALYTFYLTSDDGANLYIADELVVDNDGSHSARMRKGYMALKKGLHPFKIEYFEDFDGELIRLEYSTNDRPRAEFPMSGFYRHSK